MAALAHAVRLEHTSHASASHWFSEVWGVLSDQGVERFLPDILPTPFRDLCPHFAKTPADSVNELLLGVFGRRFQDSDDEGPARADPELVVAPHAENEMAMEPESDVEVT